MKKILSMFIVAATLGFGTTSCSDYLEEDNKTGETADLAYNTVSGIDGLVFSAYSYARGWWGKEPSLGLAEMGGDTFYYGYDNKQKSLLAYDLSAEALAGNTANNPCLDQYWEMFYAGIDVCNNVLKYVPTCTVINDTKKEAYLADAYFLRALYYSQMVATWGPIPYNAEPITAVNNAPIREPESVIYGHILDDLKLAMEKYKTAGIMTQKAATATGRAYYYSAEALYARVALYAASWLGANSVSGYGNLYTEALNAANDVISNSGAAFYTRCSDTWTMTNEEVGKNTESLFSVHYSNDLSAGFDNCVPYRFTDNGTGEFNSLITRTGYKRNGCSVSHLMFVSLWNNGADDLGGSGQKNTQVFWRVASGKTTIKSKTTGEDVEVGKYYSPYGRGFTRYLPSLYLWQILDEIKETDQRYNATLLTSYRLPKELAGNAAKYPQMADQEFKDYDEAFKEDGTTSTEAESESSTACLTATHPKDRPSRHTPRTATACSSPTAATSPSTPPATPLRHCPPRVERRFPTSMATTATRARRLRVAVHIPASRSSSTTSTTQTIPPTTLLIATSWCSAWQRCISSRPRPSWPPEAMPWPPSTLCARSAPSKARTTPSAAQSTSRPS